MAGEPDVGTSAAEYIYPASNGRFIVVTDEGFGMGVEMISSSTEAPVTPTKPVAPVTPTEPVAPVTPTPEPVAPVTPTEPVAPVTPTEPVAPVTPIEPVAPVTPTDPPAGEPDYTLTAETKEFVK